MTREALHITVTTFDDATHDHGTGVWGKDVTCVPSRMTFREKVWLSFVALRRVWSI